MNGETILVVDDNKEIVYSISELLKYEGYQIVKAYDGMEALKALETNQIDLILLDVMMPKLNGLSALMKLRKTTVFRLLFCQRRRKRVTRCQVLFWEQMTTWKSRIIRRNSLPV